MESKAALQSYRSPQGVIGRFVARRTARSAVVWAAIFGMYVASKAAGYAAAYPTVQERLALANGLGSNAGTTAILGRPFHLESVAGYTAWNTVAVVTLVGSLWALLLATRTFRGEEAAGRWELLLAGQTTMRRATAQALAGLAVSSTVLYAVSALAFIATGRIHGVGFGAQAALFLALATVMGPVMFAAIGALASQIMPTRARAATVAAAVFGVAFMLRAIADSTSLHWLATISPLGWIQKLQPLYESKPLWLLPCLALTAVCCGLAIFLAGKRDLGESFVADKNTARPHTRLLGSPFGLAVRLTRASATGWACALTLYALMFGSMAKATVESVSSNPQVADILKKMLGTSPSALASGFLGMIFLLLMVLLMCYAAAVTGNMREQEAENYLDNLLVRKVGRLQWLWGRVALTAGLIATLGMLSGVAIWAGQASQHLGLSFSLLLQAGANTIAPALFTLGIGVLGFGFVPRVTTLVAYSVVAWSFLVEMLRSGVDLPAWVLNTSILHHVAMAPAAEPNWTAAAMLVLLGAAAAMLGALRFNSRDLQNE